MFESFIPIFPLYWSSVCSPFIDLTNVQRSPVVKDDERLPKCQSPAVGIFDVPTERSKAGWYLQGVY